MDDENEKEFVCYICKLSTKYTEYGNKPPTAKGSEGLILLEDAYLLQDPFTPDGNILIVGAHCILCNVAVCIDEKCSIFYTKRFCIKCADKNEGRFPDEIQQKISKTKC